MQTREQLNRILSEITGLPPKVIASCTDRDYHMTSGQAVTFGFADNLFTRELE